MSAIIRNINKFSKFNAIMLFAGAVTLVLFYTMQLLIMAETGIPAPSAMRIIDDITMPEIKLDIIRTTPKPDVPEDPPVIPEIEPYILSEGPPTIAGPAIPNDGPVIDDGDHAFGPMDSNAMPIAQIQPQYPEAAARNGIEGFVIVQFDVNENGGVINPDILVSEPDGIFDRASIRALERWRYQPKMVAGKAVPMRGLQTRFSFSLRE